LEVALVECTVWGVKEKAEWVDVVLDVESRLGIDAHGDDAAIAKPQLQKQ
jgi:hypothetical protein